MNTQAERLTVNPSKGTVEVKDLGVTLRRILGAAVKEYSSTQRREWRLVYSGAVIGTVRLKDSHLAKPGVKRGTTGSTSVSLERNTLVENTTSASLGSS